MVRAGIQENVTGSIQWTMKTGLFNHFNATDSSSSIPNNEIEESSVALKG